MLQKQQKQSSSKFLLPGVNSTVKTQNEHAGARLSELNSGHSIECFLSSELTSRPCGVCVISENSYQKTEDLSKYLHIKRPEQKVTILELGFYQKLPKSIFH